MEHQIKITSQDYSTFFLFPENKSRDKLDFTPIKHRLFHNDTVAIDETASGDNNIKLITSPFREKTPAFAATLCLKDKIYGKIKNRFLYKCVPYDRSLPIFLAPYKPDQRYFSKTKHNIYVLAKLHSWETNQKHPRAELIQTFGATNDINNYFHYLLHAKNLFISQKNLIKMISSTTTPTNLPSKSTPEKPIIDEILQKYSPHIQDRRTSHPNIISIDPPESTDYDDAFSFDRSINRDPIPAHNNNTYTLSIYIANVPLWIDHLNLHSIFNNSQNPSQTQFPTLNPSTVYLPTFKQNMLPAILADNFCSLIANKDRFAIALDITFRIDPNQHSPPPTIISQKFTPTIIRVKNNLHYNDPAQKTSGSHVSTSAALYSFLAHNSPFTYSEIATDQHNLVAATMHIFNQTFGETNAGVPKIFRASTAPAIPATCPAQSAQPISDRIAQLTGAIETAAAYYTYKPDAHVTLNTAKYTHTSSPIRRLPDLFNLYKFQEQFLSLIPQINLPLLNEKQRAIKKIQNKCAAIYKITSEPDKWLNRPLKGIAFYVETKKTTNIEIKKYSVLLLDLNLVFFLKSPTVKLGLFREQDFILNYFENEETYHRKLTVSTHISY